MFFFKKILSICRINVLGVLPSESVHGEGSLNSIRAAAASNAPISGLAMAPLVPVLHCPLFRPAARPTSAARALADMALQCRTTPPPWLFAAAAADAASGVETSNRISIVRAAQCGRRPRDRHWRRRPANLTLLTFKSASGAPAVLLT